MLRLNAVKQEKLTVDVSEFHTVTTRLENFA